MYEHYINNIFKNPKFLFHGSPKKLDTIIPNQAYDSTGNTDNEDFAVFLTSSFIVASAYAFKNTIKRMSDGLNWEFNIGGCSDNGDVNIIFNNVRIFDDIYGYVYVFQFDDNYKHCSNSVQYKSYQEIHPIDILEIKFSNFKQFYTINSEDIKCEKTSKSY